MSNKKTKRENRENYLGCFDYEKFPDIKKVYNIKVRGVTFENEDSGTDRQLVIADTKIGEHLMLIPEDDNKYDEFAVRIVRWDGFALGYFPQISNRTIWKKINNRCFVDAELIEKPYIDGIYGAIVKITEYE